MGMCENLFGQPLKPGDLIAVATKSGSRVNTRLAVIKSIEPSEYGGFKVMARIFMKERWGKNRGNIVAYTRMITNYATSVPVTMNALSTEYVLPILSYVYSLTNGPIQKMPTDLTTSFVNVCPKCRITLDRPMGYCCPVLNCPCGMGSPS